MASAAALLIACPCSALASQGSVFTALRLVRQIISYDMLFSTGQFSPIGDYTHLSHFHFYDAAHPTALTAPHSIHK